MKESLSPILLGIRRPRRSTAAHAHSSAGHAASAVSDFSEGIRCVRPNQWIYAVKRLSVFRQFDGEGKFNMFDTPPIAPLLFNIGDPNVLQSEIEMRRSILPRGVYRFAELDILWFSTTITVINWDMVGGKTVTVPLKVFVSDLPELGVKRGDIQLRLDGEDYWIAPDWQTLFAQRPENPLSAILLPENRPFAPMEHSSHTQVQYLPGEHFQIRLTLPYPIVADRSRGRRKRKPQASHLRICLPNTVTFPS